MTSLSKDDLGVVFEHLSRQLIRHRITASLWVQAEHSANEAILTHTDGKSHVAEFMNEIDQWANSLLKNAWLECGLKGLECPTIGPFSDTSTQELQPLPSPERLAQSGFVNALILLHISSSNLYSARTRAFLNFLGTPNELYIATTLKDPSRTISQLGASKHNPDSEASSAVRAQVQRNKAWRTIGVGAGAVAGGVLIGITGGLAAPLVGAGVTAILGWAGMGGTVAGVLASGLAGSSVICGSLFGAYGAKSTAEMVDRCTKDVKDLKIVPVRELKETLAVRLCISGWLDSQDDVTAPWTVLEGDDTYALQWEVDALQKLSSALTDLAKSQAMKLVKVEIIKRTVFASLLAALSPVALLKLGKIIDNPWMHAKSLAIKTGTVLGHLLASRAFGARPVTLTGYSLGALVIHTALLHLASLPPSETTHLIQDVYLFGIPAPADEASWTRIRRIVTGRLVNGYSSAETDYVLAIVCRISMPSAAMGVGIAGLQEVTVAGVENIYCEGVEGHLKWRGMVGRCMERCGVPGVNGDAVEKQVEIVGGRIQKELEMFEKNGYEEDMEIMTRELTR